MIAAAVIVLALFALGALAAPSLRKWNAADRVVASSTVRTANAEVGDLVRDAPAQGRIVAALHPTLWAPAPGIVELVVRAGAQVKKGDVLVRIESPELRSRLAQETARLAALKSAVGRQALSGRETILRDDQAVSLAEVRLSAADRLLERAQRMFDEGLYTKIDLEKAKDDKRLAELELTHARETAKLEKEIASFDQRDKGLEATREGAVAAELERQVAALTITAPFDGVIASLAVADRDAVAANAPILTIVDLTAHEIELSIADTYAGEVVPGTKAEILCDNRTVLGHVTSMSPEIKDSQAKGIVAFDGEAPATVRQGQRVSVRLVFETKTHVTKLARGPFLESGGGHFAYVVENGVATRRPITTGTVSVSEVEITSGVSAGETVVISDTTAFAQASTVLIKAGGP